MEVHMLRNIFTSTLLVAILVILVAGNMQAQTNVSTNVNANATVISALSIAKTDIAFGNVPASRSVVLDPKTSTNNAYLGSQAAAGTVTITGANTDVLVSWQSPITLNGPGGKTLSLALTVYGDPSSLANASLLSSGADVVPSSNNYSLWVGGTMTTGTDLGAFTGASTFSVEYK